MITFAKFTKFFVIGCAVILGIIAGFNYYVDPAGIFNNKKVNLAVNYLVNGNAVVGLTNYDERIFKKELILQTEEKPETIVLGSSRAMGVRAEFDKDNNSFGNYSVSGASFRDDVALLFVYYNKYKTMPQKIILAVEPWSLNVNKNNIWKSLEKDFYFGIKLIGYDGIIKEKEKEITSDYVYEKIKTLLSISYLKNSVKEIMEKKGLEVVKNTYDDGRNIILSNGTIKYGSFVNSLTVNEINKIVNLYVAADKLHQLDNFNELSFEDMELFKCLINYLRKKNVEIILWFPPYHRFVYNHIVMEKKYENVLAAEKFYMNIAQKEHLKTIGQYDPALCGVADEDFSDGMHIRTRGYAKVFNDKF